MARASLPTLLSLDRYARILGVSPPHFHGAAGETFFPLDNRCSDVWFQHSWQFADAISREDLADAIAEAEEEIALELGFYPAPKWVSQEIHPFPRHYRREVYRQTGRNVREQRVSLKADYAKVIRAGYRSTAPVGTATVAGGALVYSDADSDGFTERAAITLPTTLTNEDEIRVYHASQGADQAWEIRDPYYKAITGGNIVIYFYAWQLIDPALWEAFPTTAGANAINLAGLEATPAVTVGTLVQSVEVHREYTPDSAVSAQFYWEPVPRTTVIDGLCAICNGEGCQACILTTQNGCLHVRNGNLGLVVPQPATWDSSDEEWDQEAFTQCLDPDFVKIWYYAGDMSNRYLRGVSHDPLDDKWARAIAQLATTRLERPFCSCGNAQALAKHWREDLALSGESSYQLGMEVLDNPFGTRRGEVMAWRTINRSRDRVVGGGVA